MAQYIKQANIFGRLGSGIGQGIADQATKEMDRSRLASGLQDFERDHQNLSQMQQLSRLAAIPGITPQVIQSFSELAKIQNQRNAYGATQNQPRQQNTQQQQQASPDLRDIEFQQMMQRAKEQGIFPGENGQQQKNIPPIGPVQNQQATPNVATTENIQRPLGVVNPLSEQALTRPPWSPQQRMDRRRDYINQGFLPEQAVELQKDDELRDLSEPKAYQERLGEIEQAQVKGREALQRHLETKLQKTGENLFKDITGDMKVNLERGLERDLIMNPKASIEHLANDWSNRGLQMAKTKNKLDALSKTTGIDNLIKDETYKKLKEYQDIFKRAGNAEEYSKILQSDFKLSPQAAAYIAFPPSKGVKSYIDNVKRNPVSYGHNARLALKERESNARKAAIEIGNMIGPDDSVLSIGRELYQKDGTFDQDAFFDQLSEDKNQIGLNERQRLELTERKPGILPYWADILIMPWGRR